MLHLQPSSVCVLPAPATTSTFNTARRTASSAHLTDHRNCIPPSSKPGTSTTLHRPTTRKPQSPHASPTTRYRKQRCPIVSRVTAHRIYLRHTFCIQHSEQSEHLLTYGTITPTNTDDWRTHGGGGRCAALLGPASGLVGRGSDRRLMGRAYNTVPPRRWAGPDTWLCRSAGVRDTATIAARGIGSYRAANRRKRRKPEHSRGFRPLTPGWTSTTNEQ